MSSFFDQYKLLFLTAGLLLGVSGIGVAWQQGQDTPLPTAYEDIIVIDGTPLLFDTAQPGTVGDFLAQQGFTIVSQDQVFPPREQPLQSGMQITIARAKSVTLVTDAGEETVQTLSTTVGDALQGHGVVLEASDFVEPAQDALLRDGETIIVTRVTTEEKVVTEDIPFQIVRNDSDDLSWNKEEVTQKGVVGTKETRYSISFHNGEEVDRTVISEEVVKEPVDEVVTKGTRVRLGKSHSGQASWYAYKACDCAANPWLPKGSYVKVTNRANGKSVIVRINDRGPFVPGRIIDLDKTAFAKIASIGAGVIDVKMEEVKE